MHMAATSWSLGGARSSVGAVQDLSGKYSVEVQKMGLRASNSKLMRFPNRVIAWEMRGISVVADATPTNMFAQGLVVGGHGLVYVKLWGK